MALGQLGGKGMPVLRRAAKPMQEDEGLSVPMLLVVHLEAVDLNRMPAASRLLGGVAGDSRLQLMVNSLPPSDSLVGFSLAASPTLES